MNRYDNEDGAALYRIDPAGNCWSYKAVAAGPKSQEASTALEKKIKKNDELIEDNDEVIQTALHVFQGVLTNDLVPKDLEVGVVEKGGKYRILSDEEVDAHLTAINERD